MKYEELYTIVTRAGNEHHRSFTSEAPFHRCSQAELPLFDQLWDLMMQIEMEKQGADPICEVWLCCERDSTKSNEWFTFGARITDLNNEHYRTFTMMHSAFLYICDDGKTGKDIPGMRSLLQWLIGAVSERIQQMKDGVYGEMLERELPYRHRVAVIDRAALWELYPDLLEKLCPGLSAEERTRMLELLDEDAVHPPKPLASMTASDYYNDCLICYRAMGLTIDEAAAPKEHYRRHADGRNGGLKEVPLHDADAFREWASVHRDAHQWEFYFARAYDLRADYKPGKGYTLRLSSHNVDPEIVRAYLALREQGAPITFNNSARFARQLRGLGKVAVAGAKDGYDLYGEETLRQQMMAREKGGPFERSRPEKEYEEIMPMWRIPKDERFARFVSLAEWMPLPPPSRLAKEDTT